MQKLPAGKLNGSPTTGNQQRIRDQEPFFSYNGKNLLGDN